jgi:hypothetical protein
VIVIDYKETYAWLEQEFKTDYNRLQTGVPHDGDDDIIFPSFMTLFDELFDDNSSAQYSDDSPARWESVSLRNLPSDAVRRKKVFSLMGAQINCKEVKIYNRSSAITWTLIPKSYHIKQGDVVWWEQSSKFGKDWEDVISITITNNLNDTEVLVYQTYGEPHGSWEWDIITKKHAAINYGSIPI